MLVETVIDEFTSPIGEVSPDGTFEVSLPSGGSARMRLVMQESLVFGVLGGRTDFGALKKIIAACTGLSQLEIEMMPVSDLNVLIQSLRKDPLLDLDPFSFFSARRKP